MKLPVLEEAGGEHANRAGAARISTWRGRSIRLLDPRPADIDVLELCESLSLIFRYNGHRNSPWSVGQHSLLADDLAALPEMCPDPAARPYVFVHDFHEAYLGDQTTPQQAAFDGALREIFPELPERAFRRARAELAGRWDRAIHARFRLATPPPAGAEAAVARVDRLALVLEVRDGFERPDHFGVGADELERANRLHPRPLRTLPPERVTELLFQRARRVLP